MLPAQRHPSRLLRFCERNATPRQQRLMAGTLGSPDRFIPARTATPNKDALLLRRPVKRRIDPRQRLSAVNGLPDPFGPSPSRSARMSDRYTTIRTPSAPQRPVSLSGTAVPDAVSPNRRAVSSGAIWTVGGTTVTEGIASVTNGRGGRVTSGTSAPHYTANFLRRQSPSEDEIQHGLRLAAAMEVQPGARMINHSSPHSTPSPTSPRRSSCSNIRRKRTVWNNNAWEKSSPSTPSKPPKKKTKDIPVIPFRVLDAPALRDDYYCSLLAYSPTAQCLAVGLGPHVYLWSEARGTTPTHIPDSLTAPFGAHVTSVSFSSVQGGKSILAIGRANGRITLWSPQDRDPRFDSEQPAPVSCVSFRPTTVERPSVREPSMTVTTEELLVGDEVGNVYYYSIEWPSPDDRDLFDWHGSMTLLARMSCHTQQICGITWSKDGDLFATGGNDNQLLLFETKKLFAKGRNDSTHQPSTVRVRNGSSQGSHNVAGQGGVLAITPGQHKHLFTLNAAVKAIAFASWQSSLLAAGGGSNDRCIHFFHALSGATLATIDCHAQVTSLVWSSKRKEIAATFGFAQPDHPYRVAVFSWPSCQRVVGIPWWSEERALYGVAYPGGPSGGPTAVHDRRRQQVDAEGRPWHGRRTRDEGCLVIATSNASIKFHEIWPEKIEKRGRDGLSSGRGLLGGSVILEDGVSFEMEMEGAIR
ncbi:hypothetical protein M409DRAFT_69260 [Zasmidium cellare ATCC 36951]|uniref:Anaphase-promoting complex subunit 4 WD40 domain-containing protein n=1 Tax=Zasmidium cellare ATCC 36951 TaxID=1080233 RepID=A0A6A6C900_ZASCE|nr:uncharacterized protein M409DRAFT_69260 [Zasmidium cellare ATCC 36951]KAF2162382.1 hypothetical protein M409DRAFT_69260 [Zasmidium cellare ATCC 36951]